MEFRRSFAIVFATAWAALGVVFFIKGDDPSMSIVLANLWLAVATITK
jgi:hypothetical protein